MTSCNGCCEVQGEFLRLAFSEVVNLQILASRC